MTLDEFFAGWDESRRVFGVVCEAVEALGPVEVRVTKSQVAFHRREAFAWAWIPDRYLHGRNAPLVLSVSLPARDASTRWKQIVEPYPGRFMHHLELNSPADVDDEVREWLLAAWKNAE